MKNSQTGQASQEGIHGWLWITWITPQAKLFNVKQLPPITKDMRPTTKDTEKEKDMKSDIYNGIRATILLTVIAAATIMCAAEKMEVTEGTGALPPAPAARATISNQDEAIDPHPDIPEPEPVQPVQAPETITLTRTQITIQATYSKPTYRLTDEERAIVEAVVASESGAEDYIGQCLVAQCVRNTAEATGMRPDEVVLQEGQYAPPSEELRYLVADAVSAVFDNGLGATTEPVRYFYAPLYCTSEWHEEALDFVLEHGGHRFFSE